MTPTSKEIQQKMTPSEALEQLKQGNRRFLENRQSPVHLMNQVRKTAEGQYPFAAVLGCIDSRAPAEHIFDQGIGDIFNVRVAGNIVNEDVLGSLEYSCKVAGSKLILVLGHTACGAVTAAFNRVELGKITSLLSKIMPAVDSFKGESPEIDAISSRNVQHSMEQIRKESPLLAEMEEKGEILIAGAMYDVTTGKVEVMD
jgi:carbonic anhydrase